MVEKEDIDESKQYNEYLITGLRTMWGINSEELKNKYGTEKYNYFVENAQKYFDQNYLIRKGTNITISHKGIFISDGIISDLMIV